MRTTIRIDEDLLRRAKNYANQNGRTLTAVIEDALREALSRSGSKRRSAAAKLPTFRGDGVRDGIDLDDSASLLRAMESED